MRRRVLVSLMASIFFLFISQLQVGTITSGKYIAKANVAVMAVSLAPEATCACGFDCGSNNCTFDCEGDFFGCISCIAGCCKSAKQSEGCVQ